MNLEWFVKFNLCPSRRVLHHRRKVVEIPSIRSYQLVGHQLIGDVIDKPISRNLNESRFIALLQWLHPRVGFRLVVDLCPGVFVTKVVYLGTERTLV